VNIHRVYAPFLEYFRSRRARWIQHEFRSCKSVLDLGGSAPTWDRLSFPDRITLLNLEDRPVYPLNHKSEYVQGSALSVPFPDQTFDLAFSNSVIEHVGGIAEQRIFATEMLRVGRRIYCQTPNRWFPVEPHFMAPFVHWLPDRWFGHFVHRYLTIHGLVTRPSRAAHRQFKASIRLLNKRELQSLFPDCQIKTERFLGLPKSYAAFR
jgi:SAM-dependent methyltransferase